MKYIFKQIDNFTPSETTVEFTADTLSTILEQFEMFLRGSGFHFTGNLDFIPEEEYFGDGHEGMGSTLDDYPELKEEHEWTKTIRGESEWSWPFSPKSLSPKPPSIYEGDLNSPSAGVSDSWTDPWKGVAPSVAMQWTANELMKDKINTTLDVCPVCKIDNGVMLQHECWDKNCPKGQDAN